MASNVSYRTIRNDFHTHHKTAGLSPFARDLFMQCLAANLVGALQRSEKQMARMANMRESDVRRGICELVERGICRYFESEETLWLIECADEQVKNPNGWKSAKAAVSTLSPVVQAAIKLRYPQQLGNGSPNGSANGSPNGYPIPLSDDTKLKKNTQNTEDRKQEQNSEPSNRSAEPVALDPNDPRTFERIIEAIGVAREPFGLSPPNAFAYDHQRQQPFVGVLKFFKGPDALAQITNAHRAWIETANDFERKERHRVELWLKRPMEGIERKREASKALAVKARINSDTQPPPAALPSFRAAPVAQRENVDRELTDFALVAQMAGGK